MNSGSPASRALLLARSSTWEEWGFNLAFLLGSTLPIATAVKSTREYPGVSNRLLGTVDDREEPTPSSHFSRGAPRVGVCEKGVREGVQEGRAIETLTDLAHIGIPYGTPTGRIQVKRNVVLTVMSALAALLFSIHVMDDIVRGLDRVGIQNVGGILILSLWLYAALLLVERRSGLIIVLVGGILAAGWGCST